MKRIFVQHAKAFLRFRRIALPLVAMGVSAPIHADMLKPLHAHRVPLGDHSAVVYYVPDGNAYEVVTTVASNPLYDDERMRLVTPVIPGQKSYVSVSGEPESAATHVLELEVVGDGLSVTTSTRRNLAYRWR